MQSEDNKGISSIPDSDLLLDRILTEAADLVFPAPEDLPEATEEEIDRLMAVTAEAREAGVHLHFRLFSGRKSLLALAASLFLVLGAGLFFSMRQSDHPGITVALALPQGVEGLRFRGGDSVSDGLAKAIESGVFDALDAQPRKVEADIRFFDAPLSEAGLGEMLISQIAPSGSRNILYVTTDADTDKLVLIVFRAKTGEELAEKRLNTDDSAQLQKDVFFTVSEWMRKNLL